MNHSASNYSRAGWRIKTDIYIFFAFHFLFFWWWNIMTVYQAAKTCCSAAADVARWHSGLKNAATSDCGGTVQRLRFRFQQLHVPHSTVIQPNAPHSHSITIPPFFLIVFIVPHFLCSSLWRMAAAVPPRRCISSGGWTAGACFNYVKAQLKTTQYESYINLQLHTIMLQSGLKRTWRCAFRTNVK